MGCNQSSAELNTVIANAHYTPPWCLEPGMDTKLTTIEVQMIEESWKTISDGTAPPFIEAKQKDTTITPISFFYNTFYSRLFDLLPECKPLFRRAIRTQGRMLAVVVKFVVSRIRDADEVFDWSLLHLAAAHNEYGVKAEWYNIVGLALLYSVGHCLGGDPLVDPAVGKLFSAWKKVYTRMMAVVIPAVVSNVRVKDLTEKARAKSAYPTTEIMERESREDEKSPPAVQKAPGAGNGQSVVTVPGAVGSATAADEKAVLTPFNPLGGGATPKASPFIVPTPKNGGGGSGGSTPVVRAIASSPGQAPTITVTVNNAKNGNSGGSGGSAGASPQTAGGGGLPGQTPPELSTLATTTIIAPARNSLSTQPPANVALAQKHRAMADLMTEHERKQTKGSEPGVFLSVDRNGRGAESVRPDGSLVYEVSQNSQTISGTAAHSAAAVPGAVHSALSAGTRESSAVANANSASSLAGGGARVAPQPQAALLPGALPASQ